MFRTYITKLTAKLNDWFVARIFLLGLGAYCIGYGIFVTGGWVTTRPQVDTLWQVALLVLLVDGWKTMYECAMPRKFVKAKQSTGEVAVIIPSYNGARVLPATLTDLLKRFAPHQIMVVSNGSTDGCAAVARGFGVRVLEIPEPVGKVGAIHAGLEYVRAPFTLLLDDDTLLGDALLPIDVLKSGFEAVAFRVYPFVNSWLTSIQSYEYQKSMDIGKPYHNAVGTVQNISGAVGLFRTSELHRQVALHTGEFSGEDLQRTLLIHAEPGSRGVVVADSIVYTQAPATVRELFRQRSIGWYPGLYANFGLLWFLFWSRHVSWRLKLEALYTCVLVGAGDVLRIITLPILLFHPWLLLEFYVLYVLLEFIPYVALGKGRGPVWVIFIYPFYGLFNFLARIAACMVFVYRRLAVRLASSAQSLDDYRHVSLFVRSVTVAICAVLIVLFAGGALIHRTMPRSYLSEGVARRIDGIYVYATDAVRSYVTSLLPQATTPEVAIPARQPARIIDLGSFKSGEYAELYVPSERAHPAIVAQSGI